ncbi:MAG: TetR/AcrR family transcriptional regulator [bacterium]|jgi:TetR/AcrR family transcriptional repressor of mexJK operon|nr:TetR/AcrR family transcriptional regulator [bacterium]
MGDVERAAVEPGSRTRSARKRRAILDAATGLFLRNGYRGTTMDEIATTAAVSKQTLYKHFSDKERLFRDLVFGIVEGTAAPFQATIQAVEDADDVERSLAELAGAYTAAVMQPEVLQLRRLMIGEAGRLPEVARAYYDAAPGRTLATLATCLRRLGARGLLRVDDPELAASHFAFLVFGMPLDRAMFRGGEEEDQAELRRIADAGCRAFLSLYRQA